MYRVEFVILLEYFYTEKLLRRLSGAQMLRLRDICQRLQLNSLQIYFGELSACIHCSLQEQVVKEMRARLSARQENQQVQAQQQQVNQALTSNAYTRQQHGIGPLTGFSVQ